jgi:hypothetical protein
LYPYKKSGIFNSNRHTDSEILSGVTCAISIDVPDMPLSYNFTGFRKIVTPIALMIPAIVSMMKFFKSMDFLYFKS